MLHPALALLLLGGRSRPAPRYVPPATALMLFRVSRWSTAVIPADLPEAIVLRWGADPTLATVAGGLWREAIGSEAGLPAVRLDVRATTSTPTTLRGESLNLTHLTFAIYARTDADARTIRDAIRAAYRPGGTPDLRFTGGRLTLLRPASGDAAMAKIPQEGGRYFQYDDDWVASVTRNDLAAQEAP